MKFEAGIALNHQGSNERTKEKNTARRIWLVFIALPTQNSIKNCAEKKEIEKSEKKLHKNKDHNEIARISSKKHEEKIIQWNEKDRKWNRRVIKWTGIRYVSAEYNFFLRFLHILRGLKYEYVAHSVYES